MCMAWLQAKSQAKPSQAKPKVLAWSWLWPGLDFLNSDVLGCRTTPIFLHNIFVYLCIYHFQAVALAQAKPGQALTEGLGLASSFMKPELSKARPKQQL